MRLESEVSPSEEMVRRTVVHVRPLSIFSLTDIDAYHYLITRPENAPHFGQVPVTPFAAWKQLVTNPSFHVLLAENTYREAVGTMAIADAELDENDHFIRRVGILPEFQRMQGEDLDVHTIGVGRQMLEKGIYWAFTHNDSQGRQRKNLHAGVILGVPGCDRMIALLNHLGFREAYQMIPEQMDTLDKAITLPATRLYLPRFDFTEYVRSGIYYETIPSDVPFD